MQLTVYHGGLARELPTVAHLSFSTDRGLAEARAAKWGEHGHVLEVIIQVGPRSKPADRRFSYLANMPMMRPGHKQFTYSSGKTQDQIKAMQAAILAAQGGVDALIEEPGAI